MAYPTVSNPYGFKAVNRVDGMPYAGAIRQIPIASSYTTAIYNGDPVIIATGGTIERSAASGAVTTGNPCGVLVGCQYVNSSGQTVKAQYFPGSGVTNAVAYVVDDPLAAFKVAVAYANAVVTTVTQAAVGTNMSYNLGTGSTADGDSGAFVTAASGANTSTLPFRVIAVVPETATSATTFTEVIVKINNHQYNTALGNNLS
jgi:hypothetical protein